MKATVKEVLMYYDGPLLTIVECEDGVWAVATAIDADLNCLVSRVSRKTIDDLLGNKVEVRDVFTKLREGPAYTSQMGDEGAVMELAILDGDPPEDWLALPGCFLGPEGQ